MSVEEVEESVITNIARFARAQISPMAAFWGGIVSQEVVKFVGKYSPLQQWLHYDIMESLPKGEVNRTLTGGRYDHQIAIYGKETQTKLGNSKLFMIGAGALGCEFMKGFALMGVGCEGGSIVCTDNDHIEVSNLNRQFLFRKGDINESKSKVACGAAKRMNPQLKYKALLEKVGNDT